MSTKGTGTGSYFEHGQELAQRSAKENLKIIMANLSALDSFKNGSYYKQKAREYNKLVSNGSKLEPEELSHVERIYEKIWEGLGEDACKTHIDKKRKGLRF